VRAADSLREHGDAIAEIKRTNAETRAALDGSISEEAKARQTQEFEADRARARLIAVALWVRVTPAHRLRPDRRLAEPDGGMQAGADLLYEELDHEMVELYAAALAGRLVQEIR
jgi:hypothetical protein